MLTTGSLQLPDLSVVRSAIDLDTDTGTAAVIVIRGLPL